MSKLYETFKKIIKLDPKKSDNFYRIKRIKNFILKKKLILKRIELLDIGSGTGIFPYLIKKFIKTSTCFEDSSHCSKYLSKYLNLQVISKRQYFKLNSNKKFDLITINKVLEHVEDPVNLLINVYKFMNKSTIIYIEVPDAKASKYGKDRGELGIEHHHLFTTKSFKSMISKTFLKINLLKQIKEPSGKYTLFAFLSLK
jgi:2-polyprenyl-3-methyl-5-hydroxy-6-metoxy-1,4-benzoquinol methylase